MFNTGRDKRQAINHDQNTSLAKELTNSTEKGTNKRLRSNSDPHVKYTADGSKTSQTHQRVDVLNTDHNDVAFRESSRIFTHEIAVCIEKHAVPAGFGLRKTRHRKYRGHGFRKGLMTRAGSVAGEVLCSDNPRVHAAGGKGKMLSHWGGASIRLLRWKRGARMLCSRLGRYWHWHCASEASAGAWLSRG